MAVVAVTAAPSLGEDVETLEPPCTAGGNTKPGRSLKTRAPERPYTPAIPL